jgi:hypothetical protein
MKNLFALCFLTLLVSCNHIPLENQKDWKSYKDETVPVKFIDKYFLETPESKSIIVASRAGAEIAACKFMQRYKVRTNADFTSSMNLYKYRVALMGADRIAIVSHEEYFNGENKIVLDDEGDILLRAGTSLQGAMYHTTIVADLFDCKK